MWVRAVSDKQFSYDLLCKGKGGGVNPAEMLKRFTVVCLL